ncbi:MAG TPA: hypothetical protein VFU73_08115 [Actinocrinis sp.]|nr:hypothetical protein [Actinocrinis sp.]
MHVIDHDALAAALANTDPFAPPYDDLDPERLSVAGVMDAARAAYRAMSHIEAFRARVLAAAERLIRAEDDGHSRGRGAIESELSATVHLAPATLRTLLAESGALCERFPETLAELSKGNVFWLQVRPLLDLTSCMSDEHARAVQDTVLPRIGDLTPRQNATGSAPQCAKSTLRAPRNATPSATRSVWWRCVRKRTGWRPSASL